MKTYLFAALILLSGCAGARSREGGIAYRNGMRSGKKGFGTALILFGFNGDCADLRKRIREKDGYIDAEFVKDGADDETEYSPAFIQGYKDGAKKIGDDCEKFRE